MIIKISCLPDTITPKQGIVQLLRQCSYGLSCWIVEKHKIPELQSPVLWKNSFGAIEIVQVKLLIRLLCSNSVATQTSASSLSSSCLISAASKCSRHGRLMCWEALALVAFSFAKNEPGNGACRRCATVRCLWNLSWFDRDELKTRVCAL